MKTIGILLAVLMLVGCQTNKVVVEKEIGLLDTVKERGYLVCGVNAGCLGSLRKMMKESGVV